MKKRIVKTAVTIVSLLVFLGVFIAGVYAAQGLNIFAEIGRLGPGYVLVDSLEERIDEQVGELPAGQLISGAYTYNALRSWLSMDRYGTLYNTSYAARTPYALNQYFPMECFRKMNERQAYAVYQILPDEEDAYFKQGEPYYIYCFYVAKSPSKEEVEGGELPTSRAWQLTGRVFSAARTLCYDDFSSVTKGSPQEEVMQIDPMARFFALIDMDPYWQETWDDKQNKYVQERVVPEHHLTYHTYHYLTDGILRIDFARNSDKDPFYVAAIELDETFTIQDEWGSPMQIKIRPQDYPDPEVLKKVPKTYSLDILYPDPTIDITPSPSPAPVDSPATSIAPQIS